MFFEIFKKDTYISEYPLTMGCKVKSVAMAAKQQLRPMLWWLTITLEADRGNIMLMLSTQY